MVKRTFDLMREFSVPLLAGLAAALLWANTDHQAYHSFIHAENIFGLSLHFLTNDLFMMLFFGLAAVEITQSCLPGGSLSPPRKAVSPLLATLSGVAGPILVYLLLNELFGAPLLQRGWGIPTATDIALAWLAARTIFGSGHPAVSFLLLLAIADDAIGLVIIALFYGDPSAPAAPRWLLLTAAGVLVAWLLRRRQVSSYWPYIIIGGTLSWIGLHRAHLHPALALTVIVPLLPHGTREEGGFFQYSEDERSPLSLFEHHWRIPVEFGLFMFGLANGGVELGSVGTVTWIVLASLIVGKTVGIFLAGMAGQALGIPLPDSVGKKELLVVGLAAGIGLTVAIFVAGEAFADEATAGAAKMGAVLSGLVAPIVVLLGKLLKVGRFSKG